MLQQRQGIETKCRTLINTDLKEICKAFGLPVSGAKAVLQKRCMDRELDLHTSGYAGI